MVLQLLRELRKLRVRNRLIYGLEPQPPATAASAQEAAFLQTVGIPGFCSLLVLVILVILGCARRDVVNPFDPNAGESPLLLSLSPNRASVTLSWQWRSLPLSDISGFRVYRAVDQPDSFTVLVDLPPDSFRYLDRSLQQNRWYFYRVTVRGKATESKPTETQKALLGPVDVWVFSELGFEIDRFSYDLLHVKEQFFTELPPVDWAPRIGDSLIWMCHRRLQKTVSRFRFNPAGEDFILGTSLSDPIQIEWPLNSPLVFVLDNGTNRLLGLEGKTLTLDIPLPGGNYLKMVTDPDQRFLWALATTFLVRIPVNSPDQVVRFPVPPGYLATDLVTASSQLHLLAVASDTSLASSALFVNPQSGTTTPALKLNGRFVKLEVDPTQQMYFLAEVVNPIQQKLWKLSFAGVRQWEMSGFAKISDIQLIHENRHLVVVDRLGDRLVLVAPNGRQLSESAPIYDPVQVQLTP